MGVRMSHYRGGRLDDEGLARLLAAMDAHLFVAEIDPVEGYRDVYAGPARSRARPGARGSIPVTNRGTGPRWSRRNPVCRPRSSTG